MGLHLLKPCIIFLSDKVCTFFKYTFKGESVSKNTNYLTEFAWEHPSLDGILMGTPLTWRHAHGNSSHLTVFSWEHQSLDGILMGIRHLTAFLWKHQSFDVILM